MKNLKPFTIYGTDFYPCQYQDSRTAGHRWYAVTLHQTGMEYDEQSSPKFATKEECRVFALDRAEADETNAQAEQIEPEYV